MYASGYVGSLDLAEAERLIRLNLTSVLYGCHTMVPWLAESAKSRPTAIINVASSFAFLCPPGMAPYNLSKAGVVALSETLHGELKPRGVGVTVVCPGPMPTRFIESASFDSDAFRQLTESYVRDSTLDPAAVAAAALEASERRQLYVVLGADQTLVLASQTLAARHAAQPRRPPSSQRLDTHSSRNVRRNSTDSGRLPCSTSNPKRSARWLAQVDAHLNEILIDHAHCEKKAAGTALNLIFAYVEDQELCREMAFIVNEELEHFQMVIDLLEPPRHPLPPAQAFDLRPRAQRPGPQAGAAAGRRSAARGRH